MYLKVNILEQTIVFINNINKIASFTNRFWNNDPNYTFDVCILRLDYSRIGFCSHFFSPLSDLSRTFWLFPARAFANLISCVIRSTFLSGLLCFFVVFSMLPSRVRPSNSRTAILETNAQLIPTKRGGKYLATQLWQLAPSKTELYLCFEFIIWICKNK